jgi:molecular chaperone GrpE
VSDAPRPDQHHDERPGRSAPDTGAGPAGARDEDTTSRADDAAEGSDIAGVPEEPAGDEPSARPDEDVAGSSADVSGDDASADPNPGAGEEEPMDIEVVAQADPRSKGELLAELITAEGKRDEYLDDLRRSHAEFENYRRRMMRDGAAQREAGKADVAGELLEVLDDLDRTLAAAEGSEDHDLAKGVELVATKLLRNLADAGLERVDATEVAFDPNVHEAVQQQPAEQERTEPMVVQVLRPGYRLGERTLRAAMVVVEQ